MSLAPNHIGPGAYAIRSISALIAFVVITLGFPAIVAALAMSSHCAVDTCGAVALVGASVLKPLIFTVALVYFGVISMRRVRDLGLPGYCGGFVPLMMLADANAALFFGAPWSYAFSQGVLRLTTPRYLIFSLACVGLLCVLPHGALRFRRGDRAAVALSGIAALIALLATAHATFQFAPLLFLPLPYAVKLGIARANSYVAIPMVGSLLLVSAIIVSRRKSDGAAHSSRRSADRPLQGLELGWSLKVAIAIALVLAVALVLLSNARELNIFAIIFLPLLLWIILPTAAFYLPLICALLNLRVRRSASAAGFVVVALLPFAFWLYSLEDDRAARRAEIARIAELQTVSLEEIPSTLVAGDQLIDCERIHRAFPKVIDIVYMSSHPDAQLKPCLKDGKPLFGSRPVDSGSLPDTYLQVVDGDKVSFPTPQRQVFTLDGNPVELRYIAPGHSDRLAAFYKVDLFTPSIPPILTTRGWMPANREQTVEAVRNSRTDFIIAALKTATAHATH